MAAAPDSTTIAVKRPVHDELRRVQVVMAAEAGRPISLGDCLRRLLDFWRAAQAGRTA